MLRSPRQASLLRLHSKIKMALSSSVLVLLVATVCIRFLSRFDRDPRVEWSVGWMNSRERDLIQRRLLYILISRRGECRSTHSAVLINGSKGFREFPSMRLSSFKWRCQVIYPRRSAIGASESPWKAVFMTIVPAPEVQNLELTIFFHLLP